MAVIRPIRLYGLCFQGLQGFGMHFAHYEAGKTNINPLKRNHHDIFKYIKNEITDI